MCRDTELIEATNIKAKNLRELGGLHGDELHGVELHGNELGMMTKWLAVGRLEETGSFRKDKRSHECKQIENVTCRRVPLHKEPLLPQI